MTGTGRRRAGAVPLLVVTALLGLSGLFRLGSATGEAIALEIGQARANAAVESPPVDIAAALSAIREREAGLDARGAALEERMQALSLAERSVADQIDRLQAAEDRLRGLLAQVREAAEGDLAKLTAVYENMKPKEAALVFERMSPEFAAGFLGRMRADSAAAIMSGLPPDLAYTISVLLAGRNADAAAVADGI